MVTVNYPDEGPVTYSSEEDRCLFEEVKYISGMTVREICEMLQKIVSVEDDPIHATGEPFIFQKAASFCCDFGCITPEVPGPFANVDLLEAWDVAERDARACAHALEHDDTTEATSKVFTNTISWLRFWSVRYPRPEWRATFARELEDMEEKLAELRAKAFRKPDPEMVEELSNV
jgi:hypothetical protein